MAINLSGYSAWGPAANLAALQQIGFTGSTVGGGQGDAYLKQLLSQGGPANLQKVYDYQQARKGLQGSAYDPALSGMQWIDQAQIGGTPVVNSNQYDQGGVATVGQVEPLHQWQQQGLTALAQPQTAGNENFAAANDAASLASMLTGQGAAPITTADVTGKVADFMNPFRQNVVDATVNTLNEQAEAAKARLTSSLAGRRSFGDSSSAIQLAELAKNSGNTLASTVANLNYTGYNDALANALGLVTGNRSNALTGATLASNNATLQSGLGTDARNRALQDITNKISAGTTVQNQNQRLLDATTGSLSSLYGYDANQLSAFANWLNGIPTSSSSSGTGSSTNGLLSIFK